MQGPDEKTETTSTSGLLALTMLLRFQGIGSDADQIRHRFGANIGVAEMLRCAKELGLKARKIKTNWQRLAVTPLPGIALLRNGEFLLVGKVTDDKVIAQYPQQPQPIIMPRAEFEALWTSELILMTRRSSLVDLARRFDITWFLGAIHKYRRLLAEVLVASFFLQLFALVSPLFFQVVIDKVLVHRSMSTLDVLVVRARHDLGVRDRCSACLRTYLFSHTTNRIDVELGARLFRHLLALPIAYFQARRVGDSVARVRELENIRNFLTSSALTLVIDLFFTFVFLAVMFLYSPLLTWIVLGLVPVLHRHLGRRDAAVPPAARREIPARRREPGLSGRERHRRRDAQGDGGRAADAAALGGAARRLRGGELPRAAPRQHRQPERAARQQARHRGDALSSAPSWSSPAI